jgi:hypothetical protein
MRFFAVFRQTVNVPLLCQSSRGHVLFFPTVPSANTLVRWVNESAFVSIVQTRPCPTFGRPVHLRGGPHRLRPGSSPHAFRIPSHDGHPALRRTNFILRPAKHYPRFWIWPSSSECQKDFNLPEQRAAQHTLWRGPTPPERARLPCGFAPSQTGLSPLRAEALQRSPGSRACCFSACAGQRTVPPRKHSQINALDGVASTEMAARDQNLTRAAFRLV